MALSVSSSTYFTSMIHKDQAGQKMKTKGTKKHHYFLTMIKSLQFVSFNFIPPPFLLSLKYNHEKNNFFFNFIIQIYTIAKNVAFFLSTKTLFGELMKI
ncbi:hypothetical protein HanIR_Chr17g0884971 [Helianthus annuus]|nr:hypothetical protein HanIR_Chr17g0884971 [Helianthus annuus]